MTRELTVVVVRQTGSKDRERRDRRRDRGDMCLPDRLGEDAIAESGGRTERRKDVLVDGGLFPEDATAGGTERDVQRISSEHTADHAGEGDQIGCQ